MLGLKRRRIWKLLRVTGSDIAPQILAMADGLIGGVAAVLSRAATAAVCTGRERIDSAMLEHVRPAASMLENVLQAAEA